jgi:maltose alpha-D-glucosyltransferase/alpha-amylase
MLGQRLGEMHQVLAAPTDNPDFAPQVTTQKDAMASARDVAAQVEHALKLLKQHQNELNPGDRNLVSQMLDNKKAILTHIQALGKQAAGGLRIRVHGDLHLGQVLVIKGDAYLIDFEGEPAASTVRTRMSVACCVPSITRRRWRSTCITSITPPMPRLPGNGYPGAT